MKHNCDGCNCYEPKGDPFDLACSHSNQNAEAECPCTQCIIKMICEEPCERYQDFRKIAMFRAKRSE